MNFSNTYNKLDEAFYQKIDPSKVSEPKLMLWNEQLAHQLGIEQSLCEQQEELAQLFSGNKTPQGAEPIALAYAGHQFGHFNPQLGDGRAHLLGEIIDIDGRRRDIQLKGSGPTRFSRGGDGRCAFKPAVREYLMSEAMHALGVPTTRCLAVVKTGDKVYRETIAEGAVVTRVAASHIRVGTFQYFAARGDIQSLKSLTDYAIFRHFPDIDCAAKDSALKFLEAVIQQQIKLVVQWMRVGFIHGVMNTDNTAISGETIDFGPCAMLGRYDPANVFSSIDTHGRYAFGNQAAICQWNMARLAESLLGLIDEDVNQALEKAQPLIAQMTQSFEQRYLQMMACKLGIAKFQPSDKVLIDDLLSVMKEEKLDYTQTFAALTHSLDVISNDDLLGPPLSGWAMQWHQRLKSTKIDLSSAKLLMDTCNPLVIPRNHHVEAVLQACELSADTTTIEAFLRAMRSPYQLLEGTEQYQSLPEDDDRYYKTFCGT